MVLSKDEQKLYDLGFRSLRPREFVSLSLVGAWKSARPGSGSWKDAVSDRH